MKLFSKLPSIVKKVLIAILVLVVAGAVFGGGKSSSSKDKDAKQEEQVSESAEEASDADEKESEQKEEAAEEASDSEESADTEEAEAAVDETYVSPEFKEAMDSYEAFMNEYVDFVKKCDEDPTDTELLLQLSEMTAREAEMTRDFDKWNEKDMTVAEEAYYLEVQSRVYARLAEIS